MRVKTATQSKYSRTLSLCISHELLSLKYIHSSHICQMSTMMATNDQFEAVSAFPTLTQTAGVVLCGVWYCVLCGVWGPEVVAGTCLQCPERERSEWIGLFFSLKNLDLFLTERHYPGKKVRFWATQGWAMVHSAVVGLILLLTLPAPSRGQVCS